MAISESDLKCHLPHRRAEDDTNPVGGAIDPLARVLDSQFTADAVPAIIGSEASDLTTLVTVRGRTPSGTINSESEALNGTTENPFDVTLDRLLTIVIDSPGGSGTITVRQGAGGTARHTFAARELEAAILFINAESDPDVQTVRYEKVHLLNDHDTLALLGAEVTLTADTANLYYIGVAVAVDDTVQVANRLAAPGGISFVDNGVAVGVPGTDLAPQSSIGVWVRQTLPAAQAPGIPTLTIRLSGSTT